MSELKRVGALRAILVLALVMGLLPMVFGSFAPKPSCKHSCCGPMFPCCCVTAPSNPPTDPNVVVAPVVVVVDLRLPVLPSIPAPRPYRVVYPEVRAEHDAPRMGSPPTRGPPCLGCLNLVV